MAKENGIFKEDTEIIWRDFQTIENQIRPGQEYGGKINGEELKRAKELFEEIRNICNKVLKQQNPTHS